MAAPTPTPLKKIVRSNSYFNNWVSASGTLLAVAALFSFVFLVWMDFTAGDKNPYLGILTYIAVPVFLILGIAMALFGAWLQRRYLKIHGGQSPGFSINLNDPRHRRNLFLFLGGSSVFLLLTAFGTYQSYHYSESNMFCGEVCHKVMAPELITYKRGSHARVGCSECHIGSGAEWFVKAKIDGLHQVVTYVTDTYKRPIETPLKNLRPAQYTCEKCHWPEKFYGNLDVRFDHYLSDRNNTPYSVRMLMHVNDNRPGGHVGGIHWHVSDTEKVEYYATDEKRQEIPWMRVINTKDGTSQVFKTDDFLGEPPADKIRMMDCMDCHNRPAHDFPPANNAIERAMAMGTLSTKLPNIKRVAVQAMTQKEIQTLEDAQRLIAEYLRTKYGEHPDVPAAIAEVQRIYSVSMFPERKADWRVYPNNIGHKDWPGCFRCHDDKHKSDNGKAVRASDCNSCHTIIGQGKTSGLHLPFSENILFEHPGGELDPELKCSDCHNGGIQ